MKYKYILFIILILIILVYSYYLYLNYEGFQNKSAKYTAIIIEPRKHKALKFVLQNILENLNSDWNIIVFHGNLNKEYINNIINNELLIYKNRIQLINLNVDNLTINEYSKLLKTKDIYNYIPTEMFLIFQTDSIILKENKDKIYNYLEYDYVGAPWPFINNEIGNGGFSLRRKSKMIEIIEKCPYTNININDITHYIIKKDNDNEDVYFSLLCPTVNIKKPTYEEALKFSSESIWNSESFGIHKVWSSANIDKINNDDIKILYSLQGVE